MNKNNEYALQAYKITKKLKNGKVLLDNISVNIKKNTLVAIIGPSGAGKTTFLKTICRASKTTSGSISYLENSENEEEQQIGYVPQENIVHYSLKLKDMLYYYAKLRLPRNTKNEEINKRIEEVLEELNLSHATNQVIETLSGGEKKRANMAAELLSNPDLFFLDEPNTGLDPYTEKALIEKFKELTKKGRTVIYVSHSLAHLDMCDQVIVIGKGGKLCFSGTPSEMKEFFGDNDYINIYEQVEKNSEKWQRKFEKVNNVSEIKIKKKEKSKKRVSKIYQFKILSRRYIKLLASDKKNLLLLFMQAPVFAILIKLVTKSGMYTFFWDTREILFAFMCCGIWMGLFNSLREICKERSIVKCEVMNNISLGSYICSKIAIISVICLIQSTILTLTYSILVKFPEKSIITYPIVEMTITIFLVALASSSIGLLVSALFKNQNRVMSTAPYLLIPHLLFSGITYELEGSLLVIAKFIVGYWGVNALSISTHLTELPEPEKEFVGGQFDGMKYTIPTPKLEYISNTVWGLLENWIVLLVSSITIIILCYFCLRRSIKD